MMHRNKLLLFFFALSLLIQPTCSAFHTVNKYFPFLERPEDFLPRKHFFQISPFYTTASTAFNVYWKKGNILELNGPYDLNDVITSLSFVEGSSFVNPITQVTGDTQFIGKKIPFFVGSKIKSVGYSLRAEEYFPACHLSVGCWMPFALVTTIANYELNKQAFFEQFPSSLNNNDTSTLIDKIRRTTHEEIGFNNNVSSQLLLGDIDLYARWNYALDHQLLMKSVNIDIQGGILIPTGTQPGQRDRLIPSWVPLMSNGHFGFYLNVVPQFELKQNLKIGTMFGALFQTGLKKIARLPVFREPANFSALEGTVKINPGATIKIAPFVILENLADGLHFQARYTYTRHAIDKIFDYRCDKTVPSYLTITPEDLAANNSITQKITADNIAQNIHTKEAASKWRSHYITFQGSYDLTSKKHWSTQKIYVLYDMPFEGKSTPLTHQLTFGYEGSF